MVRQLTGMVWSGSAVWGTLHVMLPYLQNLAFPRLLLALLTAAVFLLWLAFTWMLGRVIGVLVVQVRRHTWDG